MPDPRPQVPEGWRPQLVALDIDGTLLAWADGGHTELTITPRVQAAIHRARAAGAHVVLASGRSPFGMTPVADLLDLSTTAQPGLPDDEPLWVVASNGAVVFRHPTHEIVYEKTFDAGPAVRAVVAARPTARVAVEERGRGYRVTSPFPAGELWGEEILTTLDDLVATPVSRVIIRDPEASAEEFVELVAGLGLGGTEYVVGWTAWLDLQPLGVSKALGLQHVADALGVDPANALAIGDGRNDLEMLAWAGRGVAMGQSIEVVRAAADFVTDSVDDDGAAVELERWFP